MEKRDFGFGEISLLGFGMMRLPVKDGQSDIDKQLATEMVDLAISSGVNYFDTAWIYHGGESEIVTGEILSRYARSSYFLADKMPLMMLKDIKDVDRIFAEQLKKCQTEYFDFYLIHGVREDYLKMIEEFNIYENLLRKKEKGLIRHLGFSFHDRCDILQALVNKYSFDFGQIQLNYQDWELQEAGVQYQILETRKIPCIVMEPVKGGALAKLSPEAIEIFKRADPEASLASWALRYAASLKGVLTVLSGMTEMDHVRDNIKTFSPFKALTQGDREVIDAALKAYSIEGAVPCTSCRYCMECPEGVEIPKNLAMYNDYQRMLKSKNAWADAVYKMEYTLLKQSELAVSCISCGECSKVCPQHIDIPHYMNIIAERQSSIKDRL
ncbi:MAG: aldo/keto reductase [Deltaproteobacteria bacterium]|jgi:predicted aldo/keto reductase-like oxidoreductase|nr:aldo/keto reductase [Deltaproteobacteria bacterium]